MSLNFGRAQLAIPGPSVIPERVLAAMHRPSPNIYEGELIDLTYSLFPDLRAVARTNSDVAIYIANGHGIWEAAVKNTLNEGDEVLVLSTGRFAHNWGILSQSVGVKVRELDFGMQSCADPQRLEDELRADKEGRIKAVLTVQADTASSVINDIAALRQAIDNAGHDALYMVDCIASLGCDRYEMDDWGVDVTVSACQKGLMTPAGIGFLYFNEKAKTAHSKAKPSEYWNWHLRTNPEVYYQLFAGTPPTHHLYALREALNILVHEEGIEKAWKRHETIAQSIWTAIDAWGKGGSMHHNITNRELRTRAVSAVNTGDGEAGTIRNWCEHEAGVTLGIGLGLAQPGTPSWDRHFRIGHMGHQNVPMVMGLLGAIDAALKANDIPHGDGALEAATQVLANH